MSSTPGSNLAHQLTSSAYLMSWFNSLLVLTKTKEYRLKESFLFLERGKGISTQVTQELARGISPSNQETISTRVVEEETKPIRKPSVALQFDGLHCFETFVMN
ncbi:hypothetical protein Ahy_B10g103856 [Arachis hypogaea]|uniref:Uncharacterized protein n=1 Tax=Arachis hypogaea TaxID=3818 RepID=A0A444X498_ARAHY|nr:hypothetical protein Ahy_B10g103856 [Arachis hypogaea]